MSVIIDKNVDAKLRDGTILRADVYRPAQEGNYPVLVQRTPYNKEFWPFTWPLLDPVRAAEAGYVVAIQDVRARWASDGEEFFLYRDEFEDGHDTVGWAANLPYSNGDVGLYGISYMGASSWNAASTAPPALKAISAATAPMDFHYHLWRNGAFNLGLILAWALGGVGLHALLRSRMGSPTFMQEFVALVDDVDELDRLCRYLPPNELPQIAPDYFRFVRELMEHPTNDDFNQSLLIGERHSQVQVPAMITAGWHDLLLKDDLTHFRRMRDSAGTEEARSKTRILIGPWSHGTFLNIVGEREFGLRSSGFLLDVQGDLTTMTLKWFDQRLKGINTGIDDEPPVKYFVQGINRWRTSEDWPPPGATETAFFLHGDGALSPTAPASDADPLDYVYDPNDPTPTRGGKILMHGSYLRGPAEQGRLLDRPDVLAFTTEPFEKEFEITGGVKAILYAATDGPDTDWVVKLCEVLPDGRTFDVCDGILRASYREGNDVRKLVVPGAVVRYEIDMWATSMVFKPGHRMKVLLTSSDFPRYDRNPNTGDLGVEAKTLRPARQTIFLDANRASHVLLPVMEAKS